MARTKKTIAQLRKEYLEASDNEDKVRAEVRRKAGWAPDSVKPDPVYFNPPELVKAWVATEIARFKWLQAENAAFGYTNPNLPKAIAYLRKGQQEGLTIQVMDKRLTTGDW